MLIAVEIGFEHLVDRVLLMKRQACALPRRLPIALLALFTAAFVPDSDAASIMVESIIETPYQQEVEVELHCNFGEPRSSRIVMEATVPRRLDLKDIPSTGGSCQIRAFPPVGYSVNYFVEGESAFRADRNGCHFSGIGSNSDNLCRVVMAQDPVQLTVYKKWIGPSGKEEDVRISLECEAGEYSGVRYINERKPDGWEIRNIPPEGIVCNVSEQARESFRPDIIDCQGLWLLPGKGEECTMLNTKIVKRIEMLNRYGIVVMAILVLGVGLIAVRRLT
jgi:hypothetical protein